MEMMVFSIETAAKIFEEILHSYCQDRGQCVRVCMRACVRVCVVIVKIAYTLQFHMPSGREETWCVAYPWCEDGEVVRVKVERMGETSQRQMALEPADGSSGLFGWNTIASNAKEVSYSTVTHSCNSV